ncbi:dynamitin subunit 2 [Rhodotorula toruloides]|uniref:Dynamitin subunit 2 n=1 Tax=Rhodotorula toruloides TaxID=5286 RepID=A0A511KIT6_RHOTO|nr:dynamitin subunit 2 [Rhodotorula toruloides]
MSKYATLPDIDTGADVFETPDVPEQLSYSHDTDSDDDYPLPRAGSPTAYRRAQPGASTGALTSENIDGERLDAAEARRRFGAASLAAQQRREGGAAENQTSRRLPSAKVYSIGTDPDEREKETPVERLRRLRMEITELEEEVLRSDAEKEKAAVGDFEKAGDDDANEEKDVKGKGKQKRGVSPAVILQQLQLLRGDLQGLTPNVEGVLEADGEKEDETTSTSPLAQRAQASASLLSKLGAGEQVSSAQASVSLPASTSHAHASLSEAEEGEMEKRIARLEELLGASEADIDETHAIPPPLVQSVSRLDHLLTLLTQPRHLDSISRRIKVLVSDLERIHESRRKLGDTRPLNVALSGGMTLTTGVDAAHIAAPSLSASASGVSPAAQLPPDALQKIDALFALLPRLDPLIPLAPRLLSRLRSLSALHESATTFSTVLSTLKGEVERLGDDEKGLKEVLVGLETSFAENDERFKGNLQAFEKRMGEVVKRLDALA